MDELYVVWYRASDGWRPGCRQARNLADIEAGLLQHEGYDVLVALAPRMTAQAFAEE